MIIDYYIETRIKYYKLRLLEGHGLYLDTFNIYKCYT